MTKSELSPKVLALLRRVDTTHRVQRHRSRARQARVQRVHQIQHAVLGARNASNSWLCTYCKNLRKEPQSRYAETGARTPDAVFSRHGSCISPCRYRSEGYRFSGLCWRVVERGTHYGPSRAGAVGAMTNGQMRDLGDLQPRFLSIAGATGPSHARVHVREISDSVNIFDMTVHSGDVIHAERHGGLVIPPEILTELPTAIKTLQRIEHLIFGPASQPDYNVTKLETAWAAFENARTQALRSTPSHARRPPEAQEASTELKDRFA